MLGCDRDLGYTSQGLLIGTNTNDEETNYTQFLSVDIPQADPLPTTTGKIQGERGGDSKPVIKTDRFAAQKARIYLAQQMEHPGEVNRARYQPSNPDIIATKTRDGPVLIYDRTSPLTPIRLTGHSKEG
jgi:histone-binding protein RBBP4